MIIVDTALKKRAAENAPIRVGMIGAGFMGSGVALQIATAVPGMQVVAIANRNAQRAIDAFAQTMDAGDVEHADTSQQIAAAVAGGRPVVTEDPAALASADGVDAVLEVPAGYAVANGWRIGDRVRLTRNDG